MKIKLIAILLLFGIVANAQVKINELPEKTNADSTWLIITGRPSDSKLYKMTFNNLRDSVIGATGSTFDSTSLSNRIDGKQATLVSATNIKTINSTSLLGSGDIAVSATPAGSNTQIQFNSSGSLGASANLVWTGSKLAIGGNPSVYGLVDIYQNSVDGDNNIAIFNAGSAGPFGAGFGTLALYGTNATGISALQNTLLYSSVANGGVGIEAYAGSVKLMVGSGRTIILEVKANGVVNLAASARQVFADDTAAGVGGLATGDIYQTSAGVLMVKQ